MIFDHKYILGLSEPVGKITKEPCFTDVLLHIKVLDVISPKTIKLGTGTSK